MKINLNSLGTIFDKLYLGDRIYLYSTLASGKTTIVAHYIKKIINVKLNPISPTYVYYHKYNNCYHFDLYRLQNYEHFVQIGGEEILDNDNNICFVEWPEKIDKIYPPTVSINIKIGKDDSIRDITVKRYLIPFQNKKIYPQ